MIIKGRLAYTRQVFTVRRFFDSPRPSRVNARLTIRLEVMLQPNTGFTLERALTVFTRSNITPPKVNRCRRKLEHSETEYIVGSWPWQILGAICTVARAGEPREILFFVR